MDIQFILVIVIFIAALFYVGRLIYRSVSTKGDGCGTGCGKCAANFDNIPNLKK
ncbi:FeoB-associated Cys-rich membrane protein [Pedobacter cryotolerans]|uniref:FeoB-associated Cys-rich membrane protein n=1 Tax=Pedobacter cryotolerans TaxID=2571270 RepID=A0A4U1C8L9_9SPHI|nr:FeoB-associated Cys-rich membrane protein [Pedobacter cryotolerans]TKC01921.1 FeoB-associated Cys-rich membrane protein [Pedobacter cryotolerans]